MTVKLVCKNCDSSNSPAALFQDKEHKGKRVFNVLVKDKTKARCTVCSNVQDVR